MMELEGSVSPDRLVPIDLTQLAPDPFQPRKEFKQDSIEELAASIQKHGLLQPLIVRPMQGPGSEGRYWIVAGERRYRAAGLLGMTSLPCLVQPYANLGAAVMAIVENVHREDLTDLDRAEALQRIKIMTGRRWEEVADLVKLSNVYVRRLAGLIKLEEPVKALVRQRQISTRAALALKPLPAAEQIAMAERVAKDGLSAEEVRIAADRPSRRLGSKSSTRTTPATSADTEHLRFEPGVGLEEISRQLQLIATWLDSEQWRPERVTAAHRGELHQLYEIATSLQQQIGRIRLTGTVRSQRRSDPLPDIFRAPSTKTETNGIVTLGDGSQLEGTDSCRGARPTN